jgi:poly(3-hydroxybutyrate) depolymerase
VNAIRERSASNQSSPAARSAFIIFCSYMLPRPTGVPLPLILHGSGRDGTSLVDKWKDPAMKEGVIVAGPNAANSANWAAHVDGRDFLRDIVGEVKKTYPIDPRRMYIFGHSAGAVFALAISMWESEYFAATAVHSGALPGQSGRVHAH